MKIPTLICTFIFSAGILLSQDKIITKDNQFLEVKIISVDSKLTFYKLKGENEIQVIKNEKIKMYQWNSNGGNSVNQMDKRFNGLGIEKKGNDTSRNFGIAAGTLFGLGVILMSSAGNDDSVNGSISKFFGGLLFFGGAIVTSMVALATRRNKLEYRMIGTNELTISDYNHKVLKQNNLKPYLSASSHGAGIQLNF